MIRILFVYFLLTSFKISFGQICVRNLSLPRPESNALYVSVPNSLEISGVKNIDSVVVGLSGLFFHPNEKNIFEVYPTVLGLNKLKIYETGNLAGVIDYISVPSPINDPESYIGDLRDTTIQIVDLINKKISIKFPGSDYIPPFVVTSYEVSISSKQHLILSPKIIQGSSLTAEIYEKLKSGTKITINKIFARGYEELSVDGFFINIK